jgi:hypothetical protein
MGVVNLLPSAVRSSTQTLGPYTKGDGVKGALFILDVTAVPGTVSVTLRVKADDPGSTVSPIIATDTARTATGNYVLLVYPGAPAAAQEIDTVSGFALPDNYIVEVVHSGGTNFTYSLSVMELL